MNWQILHGDVRDKLHELPPASVQCVVTSPPYFRLRDYQALGQLGLEETPELFVSALVDVFREVRRVLAKDGVLWVNIGDSYAAGGHGGGGSFMAERKGFAWTHRANKTGFRKAPLGMKPKDLCLIPFELAKALRSDGWYLRADVIWHKPNAMSSGARDRPTLAHEYLFMFSKSRRYFYNGLAIQEPLAASTLEQLRRPYNGQSRKDYQASGAQDPSEKKRRILAKLSASGTGRNKRSVWTIPTQPYLDGDHCATFPEALVEPCVLAGSRPGDVVADCFVGSGTTGVVAIRHGRDFIGIDLNASYVELARKRIGAVAPMFAEEIA